MKQYKGWYGEKHPSSCITEIVENGIKYEVDVENGQKTGFFLDQKYNRRQVARLAKGMRVLDCCTHTGSFALNAAKGGAVSVLAMDISESALEMAQKNAERNGLNLSFRQADVFEILPALKKEHAQFDFIVLDPPAFTKAEKHSIMRERDIRKLIQKQCVFYQEAVILPVLPVLILCQRMNLERCYVMLQMKQVFPSV